MIQDSSFPDAHLVQTGQSILLMNHEKVKVHVSFTHGEGFGHPLLLATLSGKPLLSSNWSGHLDFLNPKYTSFFEGSIKQIHPESSNDWLKIGRAHV